MKVVAFATIKLNSQRVPKKNLQIVGNKPLCYHILDTARKVEGIDEIYVYCSDSEVTGYIPEGTIFLKRDKSLDGDEIKAKDTYTAFINDIDADIYIALLTTAPFIKPETITNSLNKVISGEYDSAFTAIREQSFAWYKGKPLNYEIEDVPRTQDLEPVFVETSGFFIFEKELWVKHSRRIGFKPYIQEVNNLEAVDIDTMDDLRFAQMLATSSYFTGN